MSLFYKRAHTLIQQTTSHYCAIMYHASIGIYLSLFLLSSSARVIYNDDYPQEDLQLAEATQDTQCICKSTILQVVQKCLDALNGVKACKKEVGEEEFMSSSACSDEEIGKLIKQLQECNRDITASSPCKTFSSCAEIKTKHPQSPSCYYKLMINNKPVPMYCRMTPLCGAGGGWTRIGKLDMGSSSAACPSSFKESTVKGTRLCSKEATGCVSKPIPSKGLSYTQVCGRVRGYQNYTTDAFKRFYEKDNDLNRPYVDGVSITRGSPRKHVWSLAAGSRQNELAYGCPCNNGSSTTAQPFVGDDWYCESAHNAVYHPPYFGVADPLWDGKQCGDLEGPCCTSSLPWFHKTIKSGATTDDLEFRLCSDQEPVDENVAFDQYEFYIK